MTPRGKSRTTGAPPRDHEPSAALFVRIPAEQARRLDRAAFELGLPKQRLVSELLERYVDPDSPRSLAALQVDGARRTRPVTVDALDSSAMTLGHHSFRPTQGEVLTAQEVAELLQVDAQAVLELAAAGELHGRQIGEEWRFSRVAVLRWLEGEGQRAVETEKSDPHR